MNAHYLLIDDNGASDAWGVPILIPVGGTFKHEYGTYQVEEHDYKNIAPDETVQVVCERIAK